LLVAAWHNPWPNSVETMVASPHCPFAWEPDEDLSDALYRWLEQAGVDRRRVELLPPLPHADMAAVYGNTDVGLFPNRCEGATNLVLMEYMACGRPAIVTDFAGHRDILRDGNSLRLQRLHVAPKYDEHEAVACWCEPDLDEILACLEQAYADRPLLEARGTIPRPVRRILTCERAAQRFLELLRPGS
jgi:glycosyltransferase involved in cell wall biosynthesis